MLIVDDSDEDRYLLKRYLRKTGLPLMILEASNGLEGLNLLTMPEEEIKAQHPGVRAPIVLFLDINMPVMNGWEFVAELELRQKDISLNPTVVIMYSTGNAEYEKHKIEDFKPIKGYIVKGESTPEQLKEAILNAIAGQTD